MQHVNTRQDTNHDARTSHLKSRQPGIQEQTDQMCRPTAGLSSDQSALATAASISAHKQPRRTQSRPWLEGGRTNEARPGRRTGAPADRLSGRLNLLELGSLRHERVHHLQRAAARVGVPAVLLNLGGGL